MADNADASPSSRPFESGVVKKPRDAEIFFHGGSGILCTLTRHQEGIVVLKVPHPFPDEEAMIETEKRIFRRLGEHPNIVKVIKMDDYGIWMEKAEPGCLSTYLEEDNHNVTLEEKVTWSRDVALTQQYLHDNNVRHADLAGRNLLITSRGDERKILLCDFGGSYIDGEKAVVIGRAGYRHPAREEYTLPTIRSEIHCLGSTIYEIVTERQVHHGLGEDEVARLVEEGNYPDVSNVLFGDVIMKCWKGEFSSAGDVAAEIVLATPACCNNK